MSKINFPLSNKGWWQKRSVEFYPIEGVELATICSGMKYKDRDDLLLIYASCGANIAGVFTKSLCASAPVEYCRSILSYGKARAVLVNAGNANAFTGQCGVKAVEEIVEASCATLGCAREEVYVASTGVIGEFLPAEFIIGQLGRLKLALSPLNWDKAAQAIRTTDAYAKYASRKLHLSDRTVNINAIAKGAGMIAPDMATMLAFIVTDAAIHSSKLQEMLNIAVSKSFNNISVDSDCSTSDSVLLLATGRDNYIEFEDDLALLQKALDELCLELALQIVTDGEGASHLIKLQIKGAANEGEARKIARSIIDSPLVKTAIAGCDANWGRIVMAVGKSGAQADRDKLSIYFGPYCVAVNGMRSPEYDEQLLNEYMNNYQIDITVDIGLGCGELIFWGCDLTKDYIDINAHYRS